MSGPAQLLHEYLRAVRRVTLRRTALALAVDLALLWAGGLALAVLVAGLSLRGDLASNLGLALGSLGTAALFTAHLRGWRERTSPPALARRIARETLPLRERPSATATERDLVLRHELLGAVELWQQLDAEQSTSPTLAAAYVRRIGAATLGLDPRRALAGPRRAARAAAAALIVILGVALVSTSVGDRGLELLRAGADGRPPPPPQPVWTSLELVLSYPEHTRRPDRRVPNPSGALRVPAGTRIQLNLEAASEAHAARVVVIHDGVELANAPEPELVDLEPGEDLQWTGAFTVRGSGTWVVALLDDPRQRDAAAVTVASRRSAPMRLELEVDAMPEVELLPLPEARREAGETDRVELRFAARDDFGVVEAELVYELAKPDGSLVRHRLSAGRPPGAGPTSRASRASRASRSWRHRYRWDLSAIPLEERGEVSYWIEVRDNDPGLGLVPLADGPGKVAASARQRLLVHDREAEHAANIRDLQTIRDAAVDMLAARLTTEAFSELEVRLGAKLQTARSIHDGAATLLTMIARAVDALALDTMVAERDVETLAGIHERLLALHRKEAELHEEMPPGGELERPDDRAPLLRKLEVHNRAEVAGLEDEIIRLDDLVDKQIIARIETLVARLQATQHKLVEKLEQLQAGDESVRPQIEQLEQRIRDDMRRIREAQAQLRKELGDEWMNLDAFKAMEARMRSQELLERLKRGDVDGALEQAREGLDAIRQLRDQVQQSGEEQPTTALSEEDRKRMKMLRELSRLQDEETGLRGETRRLREQWRDAVGQRRAEDEAVERTRAQANELRSGLEAINDAHLSRDGREAFEDAREALEALEALSADGEAGELELFEAANEAANALRRAQAGAKPGEGEAKALRKLADEAERLRTKLREPIPDPDEVLDGVTIEGLTDLGRRQRNLRDQAEQLLGDPAADILPQAGRKALGDAGRAMREAGEALDDAALDDAMTSEERARGAIQRAIDSLRQSSPPPPPASAGEASTEAERDRSLRDQVVEAMREGDHDGFDADTKRYYEELLR
jgi:DNA repair ATPase RecN